jgi:hypothetical protein
LARPRTTEEYVLRNRVYGEAARGSRPRLVQDRVRDVSGLGFGYGSEFGF